MGWDGRLRRLEQQDEPDDPDTLYAVVTPDGELTVTDERAARCESEYHRSVICVDGVPRILLPAGRVQDVKVCGCAA